MTRARALLLLLMACIAAAASPAAAQWQPTAQINDEVVAFAFAPDGRLAYAVKRVITQRRMEMQRDDIWLLGADGRRRRIVDGQKLVQGPQPFSYAIQALYWSPDGRRLAVEMQFSTSDLRGENRRDGEMTLLLDENGKEIKIQGADSVIPGCTEPRWLADGVSVVCIAETVKPRLLFGIQRIRPVAGRGHRVFERNDFVAVSWNPAQQTAVAVERDTSLSGPARLVWLDLIREERRELIELERYLGQLTFSPSGKYVAYFRDNDTLMVREVARPAEAREYRVVFGPMQWAPDESRLLVKRAPARQSGDLVWVRLSDGEVEPLFSLLRFRDFALSADGRKLAVTEPGRRHLAVYALE